MSRPTFPIVSVPSPTRCIVDIVDYVAEVQRSTASDRVRRPRTTASIDTLGCGFEALEYPALHEAPGPDRGLGTVVPNGAKVPGTPYQLDPIQAAFNLGAMIRWLDFNDTWLAAEWGHPSDNLGGILATADWLSCARRVAEGQVRRSPSCATCSRR